MLDFEKAPEIIPISGLTPDRLLQLHEINGIPIDSLTHRMKPDSDSIQVMLRTYSEFPDFRLLCTNLNSQTTKKYEGGVSIDSGLIGPNDRLQVVLAYQRAFVDQIIGGDEPHKIVADRIHEILMNVHNTEFGAGEMTLEGVGGSRRLVFARRTDPVPALSPFGDGDGSNITIYVYDITGMTKTTSSLLNQCIELNRAITISGLHEKFVRDFGFYEETEPLFEYEDPFHPGEIITRYSNGYTVLPNGLSVLGLTDMPIEELERRYTQLQKEFGRFSE